MIRRKKKKQKKPLSPKENHIKNVLNTIIGGGRVGQDAASFLGQRWFTQLRRNRPEDVGLRDTAPSLELLQRRAFTAGIDG